MRRRPTITARMRSMLRSATVRSRRTLRWGSTSVRRMTRRLRLVALRWWRSMRIRPIRRERRLLLCSAPTSLMQRTTCPGVLRRTVLSGLPLVSYTVDAGKGAWQYSTDGTNWNPLNAATLATAITLKSTDFLRFVPVANYNGPATALSANLIELWADHHQRRYARPHRSDWRCDAHLLSRSRSIADNHRG